MFPRREYKWDYQQKQRQETPVPSTKAGTARSSPRNYHLSAGGRTRLGHITLHGSPPAPENVGGGGVGMSLDGRGSFLKVKGIIYCPLGHRGYKTPAFASTLHAFLNRGLRPLPAMNPLFLSFRGAVRQAECRGDDPLQAVASVTSPVGSQKAAGIQKAHRRTNVDSIQLGASMWAANGACM